MAYSTTASSCDGTHNPEIVVIPLHEDWRYLEDCAKLLNCEWKRSMEARLHSLRKCSDRFPISLVMVSTSDTTPHKVFGHSRLASIPGRSADCYVESVVVDRSARGKGLGSILMHHTEHYARRLGFSRLFLSTHNAQDFYAKLGYVECSPVMTMSTFADSSLLSKTADLMSKMASSNASSPPSKSKQLHTKEDASTETSRESITQSFTEKQKESHGEVLPGPVPPPPPPLSGSSSEKPVIERSNMKVYWMEKSL